MNLIMKIIPIFFSIFLIIGFNNIPGQAFEHEQGAYDFELTMTPEGHTINYNSENGMEGAPFNATLTNTGVMPDQYQLDVSCSNGWPTIVSPQTMPIGNSVLLPGEALDFTVTVIVPRSSPDGSICDLKVTGYSIHRPQELIKEERATIDYHAPVISVSSISIDPSKPTAGYETTIKATLKNTGSFQEPSVNVSFYVDGKPIALNVSGGEIGEGGTVVITTTWIAVEGSHKIEAMTDHWYRDEHWDEYGDNCKKNLTIEVRTSSVTGSTTIDIGITFLVVILIAIVIISFIKRKKVKCRLKDIDQIG